MRFDKVKVQGKFWIEAGNHLTKQHKTGIDEGRLLYDNVDQHLYFGANSDWSKVAGFNDVFATNTTTLFGNWPLPFGWNIITNKNDMCLILTSTGGSVGTIAGQWVITGIDTQGSHDHGGVSGSAIGSVRVGDSSSSGRVQLVAHTHTISSDGLHTHGFIGAWRPAYVKFIEGRYTL
jgi:hypothetical protein